MTVAELGFHVLFFFFFNDTATTEIYTLSLHDALPICIAPDWLMAHIPMEKGILQPWLKAGCMDKHVLYPTDAGVPQGGIASPVLMNLTRTGLERPLKGAFPAFRGHTRTKVHGSRCADDCIIPGTSKAFLEQEVYPRVAPLLAERGLELSRDTTRVTPIGDGFDFLGTAGRT